MVLCYSGHQFGLLFLLQQISAMKTIIAAASPFFLFSYSVLLHAAGQKMTYCPAAFTVCLQIISGIFLSRLNFLFRIGGRERDWTTTITTSVSLFKL